MSRVTFLGSNGQEKETHQCEMNSMLSSQEMDV